MLAPALLLCCPKYTHWVSWPPGLDVDVQALHSPDRLPRSWLLYLISFPVISSCLGSLIHARVVHALMSFSSCSHFLDHLDKGVIWYIHLLPWITPVQYHVPAWSLLFMVRCSLVQFPWQCTRMYLLSPLNSYLYRALPYQLMSNLRYETISYSCLSSKAQCGVHHEGVILAAKLTNRIVTYFPFVHSLQ